MIKYRSISYADKRFVDEISQFTWNGEDYLSKVFNYWVKDGHFYGIEYKNKIIATGKITILPCKVGWLEGLRVHKDFQSLGFGRKMHNFLMKKAYQLKDKGIIESIEFSTYFTNRASISMGLKDGFRIVQKFFGLNINSKKDPIQPSETNIISLDEIEYNP